MTETTNSAAEKTAWWCLLALPVAVPLAVSKIPFASSDLLTYSGFLVPKLCALGVLTAASLIAWSVSLARGEAVVRALPNGVWLAAFLGLAVVSTVLGLHPMTAFFGESKQYTGLFFFLLCSALLFLAVQLVDSEARLRTLSIAVVAGGSIISVIALLQVLGIDPFAMPAEFSYAVQRGASTLGNPDFSGTYLILPSLLAIGLASSARRGRTRALSWVAAGLCLAALALSMTRGAWLGAGVGLLVLGIAAVRAGVVSTRRAVFAAAVATIVFVGIALLKLPLLLSRLGDLAGGWTSMGGERLPLWRDALSVLARHPILGVGPDSYRFGASRLMSLHRMGTTAAEATDAHNILLMLGTTVGIPATLAWLGFATTTIAGGAQAVTATRRGGPAGMDRAWWAATIGLLVGFLFLPNSIPVMSSLWLALGVMAAPQSRPAAIGPRGVRITRLGASAVAAVAAVICSMYLLSDFALAQAQRHDTLALSRRAVALAPWNADARERAAHEQAAIAVTALKRGDPEAAGLLEDADAATAAFIAFNPDEWFAYALRARLMREAAAARDVKSPQRALLLAKSMDAADAGLRRHPSSVELRLEKSLTLAALGRKEDVAKVLSQGWDADPREHRLGIAYAEALHSVGRTAQAAQVLDVLERHVEDGAIAKERVSTVNAEITRVRESMR